MERKESLDIKRVFGRNVRRHRQQLRISQEELAERADLHRTYIGDIERGVRNVSLVNIAKIAAALELPISRLLDIENAEKSFGRTQ